MASEEKLSAKVSTAASEVASDIGSFIRTQRENAQVSLRQLAERSGVSNPYLSQVERGLRKPSADVLNQIAKALRVSAEVLYVQAGMTPLEAIQCATIVSARAMKLDRDSGIIEAGKRADLILVDGDPLSNIKILQDKKRILSVMNDGEIYNAPEGNRQSLRVAV